MYLKSRVKVPDIHGKMTRLRRGDVTYIKYEYDRYYDPEKKYTYPQRATIGKLCVDDDTMMIPNETFLKYFPDATLSGMEDRTDRSSCLRIGTYAVIHKIIRDYTLDEMLGRFFSKSADCQPKRPPVPYSAATLELKWRSAKDTLNGQNFQL